MAAREDGRLTDLCHLEECELPHSNGSAYMLGPLRLNFCTDVRHNCTLSEDSISSTVFAWRLTMQQLKCDCGSNHGFICHQVNDDMTVRWFCSQSCRRDWCTKTGRYDFFNGRAFT